MLVHRRSIYTVTPIRLSLPNGYWTISQAFILVSLVSSPGIPSRYLAANYYAIFRRNYILHEPQYSRRHSPNVIKIPHFSGITQNPARNGRALHDPLKPVLLPRPRLLGLKGQKIAIVPYGYDTLDCGVRGWAYWTRRVGYREGYEGCQGQCEGRLWGIELFFPRRLDVSRHPRLKCCINMFHS